MKNLSHSLDVPFDDKEISEAELLAFSTDNVQRMNANSPVALASRIAATIAALNIVAQCSSDDTVRLGARKAAKDVKDTFRANLKDGINAIYILALGHYGMDAPQLVEIFPKGRSIYQSVTDDKLHIELSALITTVTAKVAVLGVQAVTDVTALKANWMLVYEASETTSGQKTTTESGKKTARLSLQLELYFNLIELMKMFPRQPEKLALYMTQSLLEDHPAAPTPPGP